MQKSLESEGKVWCSVSLSDCAAIFLLSNTYISTVKTVPRNGSSCFPTEGGGHDSICTSQLLYLKDEWNSYLSDRCFERRWITDHTRSNN